MTTQEITKLLKNYCNTLNNNLSDKNATQKLIVKAFTDVENAMKKMIEHSGIYFNRSVFIANKFSFDECWNDLFKRPVDYTCEPSNDVDEHPGIVIMFKDKTINL